MRKNNFTRPAEGAPSIELNCGIDAHIAQLSFKENMHTLNNPHRGGSTLFYTDGGQIDPEAITFTVEGTRGAMLEYLACVNSNDLSDLTDEELGQEIILNEGVNLLSYATRNLPEIEGLTFKPSTRLDSIACRGYSQGDYAEVFYAPDLLADLWGRELVTKDLDTLFNNLLWDAPVYACFNIDEVEHQYHDMPGADEYEWEREAFAAHVSKLSGVDEAELLAMLPKNLEVR